MDSYMERLEREKQHERNIFNSENILMSKKDLFSILDKSGMDYSKTENKIKTMDISEFQIAFNHKSYCMYNIKISDELKQEAKDWSIPLQKISNERYEFLGDSVIDLIIANYLFDRYPKEKEGFMTKLRTKLVCTKTLAKLSSYLNLTKFIVMSKYVEDMCEGRDNPKLLENCFESFVGVTYKLFGFDFCNDFVLSLIENVDLIDIGDLIENDDNFKDQLLRYCHKNFEGRNPVYKQLSMEGLSNHAIFTMCVMIPIDINTSIIMGKAKGANKKDAEQESAKIALKKLMANDITEYNLS
jgi:ribonuclease-3